MWKWKLGTVDKLTSTIIHEIFRRRKNVIIPSNIFEINFVVMQLAIILFSFDLSMFASFCIVPNKFAKYYKYFNTFCNSCMMVWGSKIGIMKYFILHAIFQSFLSMSGNGYITLMSFDEFFPLFLISYNHVSDSEGSFWNSFPKESLFIFEHIKKCSWWLSQWNWKVCTQQEIWIFNLPLLQSHVQVSFFFKKKERKRKLTFLWKTFPGNKKT